MANYGQKTTFYINNVNEISIVEDSKGNLFEVFPKAELIALEGAHFVRQKFEGITNWMKF